MISQQYLEHLVDFALAEDIGSGDVTAGLVNADTQASARVISREPGIFAAQPLWTRFLRASIPHCE